MRDLLPNQSRDIIREVLILTAHLVWVVFDFRRWGVKIGSVGKKTREKKEGRKTIMKLAE